MDSVNPSAMTPRKSKFKQRVAKVLNLRAAAGVAPVDGVQKVKSTQETFTDEKDLKKISVEKIRLFDIKDNGGPGRGLALEATLARLFASISSVKAAYAQLQYAQSPCDADGIQNADQLVVSELKNLSELKQCYVKKQFDPSPERSIVLAEILEQKSLAKTYEIMGRKLDSQLRLKDSEILYLKEKLEEANKQNRSLEKTLNQSGQLSASEDLHLSGLTPKHFITVHRSTVKSVRNFVKLIIDGMRSARWDLDTAAASIIPGVIYWRADDKCFTFESFFCREMFDGFHLPNFSLPIELKLAKKNQRQYFLKKFNELKSIKPKDYLIQKPKSIFAKFCRAKYLQVIHPQVEKSFFGNLTLRDIVSSGGFPDSAFFDSFTEMAKRVWLQHCVAFSFDPEASIFQVQRGSRYSEVYMECIAEEALLSLDNAPEADPSVAFTVFPGFRIGKTVIQCQVYLSQFLK